MLQFLTVKNCGCKIENYMPNFLLKWWDTCQVKWMAKLALLVVLPLKCFVFLSTVKHYIFFHLRCWHIVLQWLWVTTGLFVCRKIKHGSTYTTHPPLDMFIMLKITTYRKVILPLVVYRCGTWSLFLVEGT